MKRNTSKQLQDFIDNIFKERTASLPAEPSPIDPIQKAAEPTSTMQPEKYEALDKALQYFKKIKSNDKSLEELMQNRPSETEVEQNIAKSGKSFPGTPQIDQVGAKRAENAFKEMMKDYKIPEPKENIGKAGIANPKALAGAVVPGVLGMLAAHAVGKAPDLQLDLKNAGEGSDIVPKDEGHFNEDRKFKKIKDLLGSQ